MVFHRDMITAFHEEMDSWIFSPITPNNCIYYVEMIY